MDSNRLLSIFILLGRSPKDWDFMQEDWEDEYQESCKLTWPEFMTLQNLGWWKYHEQAAELFTTSFCSSFTKVQDVFYAISADSEEWNDLIAFLLISSDFGDLWDNCWLTRDNMGDSLQDYRSETKDADLRIIELKNSMKEWFDSDLKENFRSNLLEILTPLAIAIKSLESK